MTKGDIDRIGDKIRQEGDSITENTLNELQTFRISHKESLSEIFKVLCVCTRKIHFDNIVTYRIKRIDSIIGKLNRYPKMKLSRMWDIGGCRCILRNNEDVYKLKELIENQLEVVKVYDYIQNPQEEGYRSLHLFAKITGYDKVVEIQLRNQNDHNWATLVEISDLLFDSKLKEYKQNKKLLRFHFLLSDLTNLNPKEKFEIAKILKKFRYFEKLSTVFSRNYLQVRKQWFFIESKTNHKYFLIETKKDEVPKIQSFITFQDAELEYFNLYKTSRNANIILTHLPKPSYNQISMAYSNYILTFHAFLVESYTILESLIIESLKGKKYIFFFKIFYLYNSLIYVRIKNLLVEIDALSKNIQTGSNQINKKKRKEWENDIKLQIESNQKLNKKLSIQLNKNRPNSFLGKLYLKLILYSVNKIFKRKIKKVLATTHAKPHGSKSAR